MLAARIDEVCNRFEDEWQATSTPALDVYLEGWTEPQRGMLFRELVRVDLHYRRKLQLEIHEEQYLKFDSTCEQWLRRLCGAALALKAATVYEADEAIKPQPPGPVLAGHNRTLYQINMASELCLAAAVYLQAGKADKALTARTRALEIQERLVEEHPMLRLFVIELAQTYVKVGGLLLNQFSQPADAVVMFIKAISRLRFAWRKECGQPIARRILRTAHLGQTKAQHEMGMQQLIDTTPLANR
mgnify:FL=1